MVEVGGTVHKATATQSHLPSSLSFCSLCSFFPFLFSPWSILSSTDLTVSRVIGERVKKSSKQQQGKKSQRVNSRNCNFASWRYCNFFPVSLWVFPLLCVRIWVDWNKKGRQEQANSMKWWCGCRRNTSFLRSSCGLSLNAWWWARKRVVHRNTLCSCIAPEKVKRG